MHDPDPSLLEFLIKQAPGAKYILSVCNGSAILARAGLLDGKKATTNKMQFSEIKARFSFPADLIEMNFLL
jgi:transcriptional regulator GlxA family with amidase domain